MCGADWAITEQVQKSATEVFQKPQKKEKVK